VAEGTVDLFLECKEGFLCCLFGFEVSRDCDVDYAARGNVWWEENGWKFNLVKLLVGLDSGEM